MSARARGFIEAWHPRTETWELLYRIRHVLDEYVEQLPLTLRQIFYILVGRHAYEKTERAYERLCERLNKARRAKVVDMDAVRDDGFTNEIPNFFGSSDHFLDAVRVSARLLRLDRQARQARRLALWCEASGMVPQLQRIADPFGIAVRFSGGFDSVTAKHQIARQWTDAPVTVLHIGDNDPSGVHCFSFVSEDVASFADHYGGDVQFVRLAVTPEQAAFYELPTAPPKPTDQRRFDGDETWQAEALDPRDLADIVRGAIEKRIDRAAYERVLEEEGVARFAVLNRLGRRRER
jgi:hypothetical protein